MQSQSAFLDSKQVFSDKHCTAPCKSYVTAVWAKSHWLILPVGSCIMHVQHYLREHPQFIQDSSELLEALVLQFNHQYISTQGKTTVSHILYPTTDLVMQRIYASTNIVLLLDGSFTVFFSKACPKVILKQFE